MVFNENLWNVGTIVKLWRFKKRQNGHSSTSRQENENVNDNYDSDDSQNEILENGLPRGHYEFDY